MSSLVGEHTMTADSRNFCEDRFFKRVTEFMKASVYLFMSFYGGGKPPSKVTEEMERLHTAREFHSANFNLTVGYFRIPFF